MLRSLKLGLIASILLMAITLSNCKLQKKFTDEIIGDKTFSTALIKYYNKAERPEYLLIEDAIFTFESDISTKLRMVIYVEKDKMIFLSGRMMGFEIFRFKLTTDSVFYINRFKKSYYENQISEIVDLIPKTIDFIDVQDFIYTGIINGNELSKNFIRKEFGYLDNFWVYKYAIDYGIDMDLLYSQDAKLTKVKYVDSIRDTYMDLNIKKFLDKSAQFTGLFDNREKKISFELTYKRIINEPFKKTDFKVNKSYDEKPEIF